MLAQVAPVAESISRGEELIQAAKRWLTENGLRFAASLVTAVIIYLLGAWFARVMRSLLRRVMIKRGLDETFASYLANIVHAVILMLVIITALGELGIPTAQFAALIAAAGLAIGLALQGNLSNFASGFMLVFFRPFKRGDFVTAGGSEGAVEEIGIFTTTMTTPDNRKVVVPNSAITGGIITNFTTNPRRLVVIPCTVGAGNEPATVRASLLSAPTGNKFLLSDPPPVVVLTALGENKYTMELRASCPSEKYGDALSSLNEAVKAALDRAGVTGPLPSIKVVQDTAAAPARSVYSSTSPDREGAGK
jgi:small conductance mechanosensitive channel